MLRKSIKILLLSTVLMVSAVINAEEKTNFTDPTKIIAVDESKPVFKVVLQANPTTGYSWVLKGYDDSLLVPIGRKFYPANSKRLVGAPGREEWTFKVRPSGFVVPQITSVTLVYLRPWDEQGAQTLTFKVVTSGEMNKNK